MRILYNLLTLLFSVVIGPLFVLRARGRSRLAERYGNWNLPPGKVIWFHGASNGEVLGLIPIIKELRAERCATPVLLTATSVTGLERAGSNADYLRLLPFDHPLWLNRALRGQEIEAFVFGETEIWPALISRLSKSGVPIFMVNAKLSDFSIKHYRFLHSMLRESLQKLSGIFALNEKYAARFETFGAPRGRLRVLGNAKYDTPPSVQGREMAGKLKAEFFQKDYPVLVLGSVHPGEEIWWLSVLRARLSEENKLNIVFAPRHTEKFNYFADKLDGANLPYRRRSGGGDGSAPIVLLDTLGELERVYSFADVAFIGGTLIDGVGGHNPLEACAYSACVCMGPHCQNIDDLVSTMNEQQAYVPLTCEADIVLLIDRLCASESELRAIGERGREHLAGEFRRQQAHCAGNSAGSGSAHMNAGRVAQYSAARIFGGVTALRNWAYDRGLLPVRSVSIPVVSIGNITAGGNAKTPLTMMLARELISRNMRPAVLTRGYGGSSKGPIVVTAEHTIAEIGDEPFLMYRRFSEDKLAIPIVIARERITGARLIEAQASADVILLDDGFQHRRLHRDVDIVSVNVGTDQALQEFMQGLLLPRGRFREERDAALARCHILIFSERKPAAGTGELNPKLLRMAPKGIQMYRSFVKFRDFVDVYGPCPLEDQNIGVVCGIANPENFIRTVESLGFTIVAKREYPDHHEYSREDMLSIRNEFGAVPIVCTEKDFVKLMQFSDVRLYALRVETEIRPRDAFVTQLMRMILQAKEARKPAL